MAVIRVLVAGALLLAAASCAHAQQDAAPARGVAGAAAATAVQAPTPTRLAADWWSYFDTDAATLVRRTEDFASHLEQLANRLSQDGDIAGRDRALELIPEIVQLVRRYPQRRSHQIKPAAALPPPAESYTPEQLLQAGTDLREARVELEFERDEVARQEPALKAANSQINDAKAAYLALGADSPERLVAGLSLMRDRLAWALGEQDLRLRRARIESMQRHTGELEQRLATASARLRIDAATIGRVRHELDEAETQARTLRAEATVLRLRDEEPGDSPATRARVRLHSQRLLGIEARFQNAELRVAEARLKMALAAYLTGAGDSTLEALREARKQVDTRIKALQEQVRTWRRATNRERSAASAQVALVEADDTALAALHRERIERADDTLQTLNRVDQEIAAAALLVEVAEDRVVEGGGRLEDVLTRTGDHLQSAWETLKEWATASLFEINETPVTMVGLIRVALILFIAWWLSKGLAGAIGRVMERRDSLSRASLYTLQRLSTYGIVLIGFFVGLSSIGIDFTKFALVISALGVGLGFGLQTIFSNFVAGLIILFEKSLKVGDFVELESGVNGEVREINIRSTLVTTNDNIDILVPNSEFVNGRVTNWTLREAFRRLRIPFGVAYGTDKEKVRKAALEAAEAVPFTLKNSPGREPRVWLVEFGDSSLKFELVVWLTTDAVKRPSAVHAAYTWEIESALVRYGIEIPFPQRDLHLRSAFGHRGDDALGLLRGAIPPGADAP